VGKQTRAAVAKACSGNVTPPTLGNGHLIIYQDKNIVIEGDKPESQAKDECKFFVANNSGTIRCTWNGKEISRSSLPTGTPEIKADVDGSYLLNIVYNNLPLSKITLVSVTTGKEFDVDDNVSGSGVVKEADFHNKANDAYYLKVVAHSTGREVARSNTFYIGSEKPGLSCSIWPSKSTYVLGETITFNWSSTNATYAAFVPATFDKDNLSMPGDKLPASGSQQITAHVLGNPSITLAVYGADNTSARCTASVNVIQSSAQSITVTAPNGGESIAVNDITQVKIAWRMDGISTPISIALYKNDQQLFWIEKNVYLDKSPDGTYSYVWAPNAKGPALPALDSGVNSGFKIHITGQKADGTGYVDDKSDAPFGFISTQSSFGTYQGYMNGNLFITTKEISQTDALTNCILNAQNNPDATTRCTWNGIEIYNNGSTATIVFPNQLGNYSISTELRKPESGSKCEMVDDSITDRGMCVIRFKLRSIEKTARPEAFLSLLKRLPKAEIFLSDISTFLQDQFKLPARISFA